MPDLQTGNTNLHTASLTQAIAYKLLVHWGYDGFIAHCDRVAKFYADKLKVVEAAAKEHLHGLAEWNQPRAGMFLWFKLNITNPGDEESGDSKALIATTALKHGVLAVPGYVRFNFCTSSDEVLKKKKKKKGRICNDSCSGSFGLLLSLLLAIHAERA